MVDMNAPLSDEIELEIAKIDQDEVIDAVIRWNDNGETENVKIAMHADMGFDDGVFYYCDNTNDFRALMRDEHNADFKVIAFDGYRAKYPRVKNP